MKPRRYQIHFHCPDPLRERLYAGLLRFALSGIEENEDGAIAYVEWEASLKELQQELEIAFRPVPDIQIRKILLYQDRDWYTEWRQSLQPIHISERIAIIPPETATAAIPRVPIPLFISRKATFGTGEHATTQMCLRLLESIVTPQHVWLDAGTGTGILAIAIARLGARMVIAIDNEEAAIAEARQNAERNAVEAHIHFRVANLLSTTLPPVDGIVANLYLHLHRQLLPAYASALPDGGYLVCSGLLRQDRDEILELLAQHQFTPTELLESGEWIAVQSRKQ